MLDKPIRQDSSIPYFSIKHNYFKNSFFPTIFERNYSNSIIIHYDVFVLFKKRIIVFIRPYTNCHCHILKDLKIITILRVGLSYLLVHKFKHNLQDTLNPLCSCIATEKAIYYSHW